MARQTDSRAARTAAKTIAILALPGVQLLDVAGPLDVFAEANVQASRLVYELRVISTVPGSIRCSSGAQLCPDFVIGSGTTDPIDTLLVAGCPDADVVEPPQAAVDWLAHTAPTARRFGSVCAGAFVLAATGLLDGKRITTHWAVAQNLSDAYPAIKIEEDAIHVRDGQVRTAAGVTAGLDLALALVEEDLGRDIAMRVAAQLVMFFKRPGGQMQFVRKDEAAVAGRSALQELQRWVVANPSLDHRVTNLAERMGISSRHFARLFRKEIGITPAGWVEAARVTAARRLLETGCYTPKQVAAECGFTDVDIMRRAFGRHVGVSPAEYKKRFAAAII
ncbi:GlxA family transcriptional regulator [Methylovirgula sp. 4M-Z18]|uniref:GlxA family transcriptional regulator n=1 Tax=Methylovirgula sp. 4M-Z18 TaxID=2293567 RepID=UPI000E2FA6D2|nr:GlxA family transcriptional regulator [Methylovirgula sp. 4M-Z18]RFB80254.1 GlxA family transcriptional regulator [Methylovirgula sp. 4M-Z18]